MKVLARKIKMSTALKLHWMIGAGLMAVIMIALPVGIFSLDSSFITNPYIVGVVVIAMTLFGLVGYFGYINQYLLFRKLPEIQAETDGEYLYIHSKKEAKIAIADLDGVNIDSDIPYLFQEEFAREILVNLLSDEYGKITLYTPNHGNYKLYFISQADETVHDIADYIIAKLNEEETP